MAVKERKTRQVMTRAQVIQASDLFRESVIKQDDGLVSFKEGFSDESIAETIKASPKAVSDLRVELYGRLKPARLKADAEKVQELIKRVELLDTLLHELRVKYHKLILSLSLQGMHKELKHLGLVDFDHMGNPLSKKQEK